jgi:hypothetical protein
MEQVRTALPLEPRKIDPEFPWAVQHILARMLKKKPGARYQTVHELIADLDDVLEASDADSALQRTHVFANLFSRDWR